MELHLSRAPGDQNDLEHGQYPGTQRNKDSITEKSRK